MATFATVHATSTGFSGGPGFHTFHFGVAVEPFNSPAAVLACQRVIDAYTAARNLWPGSWSITVSDEVEVADVASGTLTTSLTGTTGTVTGNAGAGTVYGPSAAGIVVAYTTAGIVNGKHVRGRTFHVPVASVTNEGDGTPTTGAKVLATAFGVAIRNAGATDCVFGVYSRKIDAAHATAASPVRDGSFHGATGSTVSDKYAVLRSRRD